MQLLNAQIKQAAEGSIASQVSRGVMALYGLSLSGCKIREFIVLRSVKRKFRGIMKRLIQ